MAGKAIRFTCWTAGIFVAILLVATILSHIPS